MKYQTQKDSAKQKHKSKENKEVVQLLPSVDMQLSVMPTFSERTSR